MAVVVVVVDQPLRHLIDSKSTAHGHVLLPHGLAVRQLLTRSLELGLQRLDQPETQRRLAHVLSCRQHEQVPNHLRISDSSFWFSLSFRALRSELLDVLLCVTRDRSRRQGGFRPITERHSAPSVAMAESELHRCVVCSVDMTSWRVVDREAHVNACLDEAEIDERYDCPTCSKELSHCDERQRLEHVNRCLDAIETKGSDTSANEPYEAMEEEQKEEEEEEETEEQEEEVLLLTQVAEQMQEEAETSDCEDIGASYVCKICGIDISSVELMQRIRHVKSCGQKFGVRAADMADVEQAETIGARLDEKATSNAFVVMMQSASGDSVTQSSAIGGCGMNALLRPVYVLTRRGLVLGRYKQSDQMCLTS